MSQDGYDFGYEETYEAVGETARTSSIGLLPWATLVSLLPWTRRPKTHCHGASDRTTTKSKLRGVFAGRSPVHARHQVNRLGHGTIRDGWG